ncbi:hypothetical protein K9M41_00510 [Candidatus Gracilibacteria bacterium]|nr:hypothetical protein [Candidatus Gracilibacteria bacterium]
MKVDLGLRLQRDKLIGEWLEKIGLAIFILTFWWPNGFYLGGDATFLGNFHSELEVVFPVCGIGIFLIFFGKFLSGTQNHLSKNQLLFLLSFLGFSALAAVFSVRPEVSILFLIIWATGFLSLSFGDSLIIKGLEKRFLLFLSLLIGVFLQKVFPALGISAILLGIGALLGIIFAMKDKEFRGRFLLILFYTWIVFETAHLGLILLAFLMLFGAKFWLPRAMKNVQKELFIPLIFLIGLSVWGIFQGNFRFGVSWGLPLKFFQEFQTLLFGAGEGQFLIALQDVSKNILLPENFWVPSSGFLLALSEKGFLGIFFLGLLCLLPFIVSDKKKILFSFLFLYLLFFTSDLIATENGILFLSAFLLATEKNGRYENGVGKIISKIFQE